MVDQRVAPQETVRRELKTPPILFAAEHKKSHPSPQNNSPGRRMAFSDNEG
jgi:hypothetical protein